MVRVGGVDYLFHTDLEIKEGHRDGKNGILSIRAHRLLKRQAIRDRNTERIFHAGHFSVRKQVFTSPVDICMSLQCSSLL